MNQRIKKNKELPELYKLVKDFRNHQRKNDVLKLSSSHSAFAALRGENQDEEAQDGEKLCLCGGKHGKRLRWEKCEYITPKCRPSGWKGKPEAFEKINKTLSTWDDGKVKWFVDRFKYDGLKDSKKASTSQEKSKESKEGEKEQPSSFVTYSSFHSISKEDYKLYNSWTLDNASDIHVCNDVERSNFTKTHDAMPGDELCSGKTWYPIEAFGTVTVNI